MLKDGQYCPYLGPVVDGIFLTDSPKNLREAGSVARVPEMIGTTREETSLFVLAGNFV